MVALTLENVLLDDVLKMVALVALTLEPDMLLVATLEAANIPDMLVLVPMILDIVAEVLPLVVPLWLEMVEVIEDSAENDDEGQTVMYTVTFPQSASSLGPTPSMVHLISGVTNLSMMPSLAK